MSLNRVERALAEFRASSFYSQQLDPSEAGFIGPYKAYLVMCAAIPSRTEYLQGKLEVSWTKFNELANAACGYAYMFLSMVQGSPSRVVEMESSLYNGGILPCDRKNWAA